MMMKRSPLMFSAQSSVYTVRARPQKQPFLGSAEEGRDEDTEA